jgi:hypothetical protein
MLFRKRKEYVSYLYIGFAIAMNIFICTQRAFDLFLKQMFTAVVKDKL